MGAFIQSRKQKEQSSEPLTTYPTCGLPLVCGVDVHVALFSNGSPLNLRRGIRCLTLIHLDIAVNGVLAFADCWGDSPRVSPLHP